jgi:hypothetical protein
MHTDIPVSIWIQTHDSSLLAGETAHVFDIAATVTDGSNSCKTVKYYHMSGETQKQKWLCW